MDRLTLRGASMTDGWEKVGIEADKVDDQTDSWASKWEKV